MRNESARAVPPPRRHAAALLFAAAVITAAASLAPARAAADVPPPVPVLVVPGLLGSFSSCLFDAGCPEGYTFAPNALISITVGSAWVLDPIDVSTPFGGHAPTYESLIDTFLANGYVEGTTLFRVPFDWRRRNQETAATIGAAIDAARAASGSAEVDVVAHSMGGLATRYLVEALGRADVRRIAFLGTPHQGSAKSYNPWEGGDFSRYDGLERTYLIDPAIAQMKASAGMADASTFRFVQAQIPSVRQLLPTVSYLRSAATGATIKVGKMYWRNDLVPDLSTAALDANVGLANVRSFAGTGSGTLKKIEVKKTSGADSRKWRDGKPVKYVSGFGGDDTVLSASACLPGAVCELLPGAEHGLLPDAARARVFEFIAGFPPAPGTAEPRAAAAAAGPVPPPPAETLAFTGRDRVLMALTAPDGRRIGLEAGGERFLGIPDHRYAGSPSGTGALGVADPAAGAWTLTVTAAGAGEVSYEIDAVRGTPQGRTAVQIAGTVGPGTAATWRVVLPVEGGLEAVPRDGGRE